MELTDIDLLLTQKNSSYWKLLPTYDSQKF